MAELAASIIGIATAGTKVALVLSQLASEMGSAGKEARSIASEIRSMSAVLRTLHDTFGTVKSSAYFAHCVEVTDDLTSVSLEMYSEIITITKSLEHRADSSEGRMGLKTRFYWVAFQKPKIVGLRAALEAYKSNLLLVLGTLNIAEKAARPMSFVSESNQTQEHQDEQALLVGLKLDHEAALLDLQQAEENARSNEEEEEADGRTSPIPVVESKTDAVPTVHKTVIEELEKEIWTLRSSRSSLYSLENTTKAVSRQSRRLSQLLVEDEKRNSVRWSMIAQQNSLERLKMTNPLRPLYEIGRSMPTPSPSQPTNLFQESPIPYVGGATIGYCFSWFDFRDCSYLDTCQDAVSALFSRHGLAGKEDCRKYIIDLLDITSGSLEPLEWDQKLWPTLQRYNRAGRLCGIVLIPQGMPVNLRLKLRSKYQNGSSLQSLSKPEYRNSQLPSQFPDLGGRLIANPSASSNSRRNSSYFENSQTTSPSDPTDILNFRCSVEDPCWKVLPQALRKYGIPPAEWPLYALYICYEDYDRCIWLKEMPLLLFRTLQAEGKNPKYMLRKHSAAIKGKTYDGSRG